MTTTEPPAAAPPDARTAMTRRTRRARRAVRTVLGSRHGTAACTGKWALFDAAENELPCPASRIEAAAVCGGCPLLATCGFRIIVRARDLAPSA
ncbi:hypothetical protein [Streptomyces tsukubensis]|uniref:hypothetical protein n=1 Tax=Streptomyces tsukubensis TaxID=83656 RepID=UPI00344FA41B